MPTYNNAIPQPTDNPSQSQDQILQNFQVLYTAFEQDHSAYNSPTAGQHDQLTFPVGPLTGQPFSYLSGQIGVQSLSQSPTSRPDLWLSRGTGTAYPITGYFINGSGTSGWSYDASGCIKCWGQGAITSGGTVTITYGAAAGSGGAGTNFPGFNQMGNPIAIVYNTGGATLVTVSVSAYTITNFTVYSSTGANCTFIWSAMGF